jgi:hypothetical protein
MSSSLRPRNYNSPEAEWAAGVAKIIAEVRRRETERATADLCQWDGNPLPSITFRSEERAP